MLHQSTERKFDVAPVVNTVAQRDAGEPMIELAGLCKVLVSGGHSTQVLSSLDLRVNSGEFVAVMGPSGSGKTTLLNLIGGLDRPTRGKVRVLGATLDQFSRTQLAEWRAAHVGYVFQFYNLIPVLSALRNVELPLSLRRVPAAERRRRAAGALELVGLSDRMKHHPHQLSGGEQQRVAIARAFVGGPSLLLCDEPTGDLDRETGTQIMELLRLINMDGKTVIMVTHDPIVAEYADRLVRLDKGVISQDESTVRGRTGRA
jgi:putative ABC transport system ATP-binding protein